MKRFFSTILLPICLSAIAVPATLQLTTAPAQAQAARSGWRTFNGPGFSVQMPGTPKQRKETITVRKQRIPTNQYFLEKGNMVYVVVALTMPVSVGRNSNVGREALEQSRQDVGEMIRNGLQGRIVAEQSFTLNGYPGKEFVFETATGSGKLRAFVVNNRTYTLAAIGQGNFDEKLVDGFLRSFKLTGK